MQALRIVLVVYSLLLILTFGSVCYFTIISSLSIVDFFELVLALVPIFGAIGIYLFSRAKYSPKLLFRMSGEQQGEPIPLNKRQGSYLFGIGTQSAHKVTIDEISVHFKEEEASLNNHPS